MKLLSTAIAVLLSLAASAQCPTYIGASATTFPTIVADAEKLLGVQFSMDRTDSVETLYLSKESKSSLRVDLTAAGTIESLQLTFPDSLKVQVWDKLKATVKPCTTEAGNAYMVYNGVRIRLDEGKRNATVYMVKDR